MEPAPKTESGKRDLSAYRVQGYSPGRNRVVQLAWYLTSALLFQTPWFPVSRIKLALLRLFGARIGRGVVLKPCVRIKFPWRLTVGDFTWIGESVWIDNLAEVTLGSNVCLSQGAYLCTGSHDARKPAFDLITRPIRIEDGAWICAQAVVLCGVTVGAGAVVAAGCVVGKNVTAGTLIRLATESGPLAS